MNFTGEILAAVCAENGMQASLTETGTPQMDDLVEEYFLHFSLSLSFPLSAGERESVLR